MKSICTISAPAFSASNTCSAILGAVAGGVYPDIDTAAEAMTDVEYTVEPNQERHEEYMFYFEKYKEIYAIAKDWMHSVTNHVTQK